MLTFVLLLIFLLTAVLVWFHGLWNSVITLINVLLAGMLAVNFYEPISAAVMPESNPWVYLVDFMLLWGLFAITFIVLRFVTEFASNDRVQFIMPVEMAGRSILAIWVAWIVVSFAAMTLHTAPIQATPFNGAYAGGPTAATFLGTSPERFWLSFMRARSTGVFSNGQTFDPQDQFLNKYHKRRSDFAATKEPF